jgi:muramidase (phage lysozyme)
LKVLQTLDELRDSLRNANVQAWLRLIREGESDPDSDDAYWALFGWNRKTGGPTFSDAATHPRQAIMSPWGWTSAAGAYQAMAKVPGKVKTDTWDNAHDWFKARGYQLTMSRLDQDLFAVWCTTRRGALLAVKEGHIGVAMALCNLEWASLPGSAHGQPTRAADRLLDVYRRHGGTLNAPAPAAGTDAGWAGTVPAAELPEAGAPTPGPAPSQGMPAGEAPDWVPPQKQETTAMDPFTGAALSAVINAVPSLIDMFKGDSRVAERNAEVAKVVVGVAKEAIGAKNEQELVQRLQDDPASAEAVRLAIHKRWFEVHQAVEKSMTDAREFAMRYSASKDVRTVAGAFTFIELLTLFLAVSGVLGGLAVLKWGDVGPELKGAIITLILIESVVGIRKFWFGNTSAPDADKGPKQ